ncbi:Guanylate kinase [Erythrobacter dokdonensis DSW-74]|uniref:Guanylate kinase n=1 Tax=Erythrobacter dokdonensis DSW-74 TaxID=1300349 RepID=A0A1A7BIH9_9SPHN|nr:Guanylate kinase [Erythrobacter dokdonensis DSW-74]
MVRRKSKSKPTKRGKLDDSRLPSPDPVTNLVIADIVLRGAGSLLRQRLEKGLLTGQLDGDKAKHLVESRGMVSTLALWGASRLATRSPVGLAVVAGGLAAKVLYDRGKQIEAKRRARKAAAASGQSDS